MLKTMKLRCPICDRIHSFAVCDDVPVQKFDRRCATVTMKVIARDKTKTVRSVEWEGVRCS